MAPAIACSRACLALQRLGEQLGQVEHLDVAVAQRLGERVVLLLGAADPRDAVEQQLVVVARGEPLAAPARAGAASPCAAVRPRCSRQCGRHAPTEYLSDQPRRDSYEGDRRRGPGRPRRRCSAAPRAAGSAAAPGRRARRARTPRAAPPRRRRRRSRWSSYFATRLIVSSCDRSPHSAANSTRNDATTALRPVASSVALAAYSSSASFSSASAPGAVRNSTNAPSRKIASGDSLDQGVGQQGGELRRR